MNLFAVLKLIGGLALFLYGMDVMGSSLEKLAGGKLERIFEKLTSNPLKAVLLGAGVTAVIQSSAATTVMLVGFVNSGIMKLHQAIGIIMGANIGTTVTAWLLSLTGIEGDNFWLTLLKPSSFTPILALIGLILYMFVKSGKKRDIGAILLGFAILMFGMDTMSGAIDPQAVPGLTNILTMFSNPFFGVLAGIIITAVLQSSSASVGVLQALSATGAIKFGAAIPIILGQNIGSCVTALISSVGTNKAAKRVAIVHLYFNIIGTVLFLAVFYILNSIIDFSFLNDTVGAAQIAIVHTLFNFGVTIILLPFIKVLEKLAYLTIREDNEEKEKKSTFALLDDRFLATPSVALAQCRTLLVKMSEMARENIRLAIATINKYDADAAKQVEKNEDMVDKFEDKIGTYLVKLSSRDLSVKDSQSIAMQLHVIGDFERISDHSKNIIKLSNEMHDKKIEFSKKARAELKVICRAVTDILDMAVEAFTTQDKNVITKIEALEEAIDKLCLKLRNRHIKRLQKGTCTIELGFIFTDLLTNLERVSDHCSNIASSIKQADDESFESHKYVRKLKETGENFDRDVEEYMDIYHIPKKQDR